MYSQISEHLDAGTFQDLYLHSPMYATDICFGMNYKHYLLIYFQQKILGIIQGNTNKEKSLVIMYK
jgi:hypothetical protein